MELKGKNQKQILKEAIIKNKYLFIILILALFLRVYGLSAMGLGVDETLTIKQAKDFSQISYLAKTVEFSPPLYYLIAFTIFQTTHDFFYVRLFSAIMGVILVLLIFMLAKEIFGENTAIFASFLAAINPNLIAYSHLMRNYEFFFVLMFLTIIFTKKYAKTGKNLANLAASNAIMLLTAYHGFFILAAECLFLKLNKVKNRIIIGLIAIAGISLLPLIPLLLKRTADWNAIYAKIYFLNLGQIAIDFFYMLYKLSIGGLTLKTTIGISPALFIVIPIVLFLFFKGIWIEKGRDYLLHYFLLVPAGIAFVFGLSGSLMFNHKYLAYLIPIFLIFVANGLSKIKNQNLQKVLLAIIIICWAIATLTFYSISKTDGWNAYFGL